MEVTASIHLVGEKRIRELNKKYRKQNKVTDVLSFPLCEIREIRDKRDKEIGDVFLCVPRIKKQSKEYGVCLEEEFCRMLTRGIAFVGFDHKKERGKKCLIYKNKLSKTMM